VVAGDVAQRVRGGHDGGGEREGDHPEIRHGERRLAVDDDGGRNRADPDEDQDRRAIASAASRCGSELSMDVLPWGC